MKKYIRGNFLAIFQWNHSFDLKLVHKTKTKISCLAKKTFVPKIQKCCTSSLKIFIFVVSKNASHRRHRRRRRRHRRRLL